jgi:hypothetical protein
MADELRREVQVDTALAALYERLAKVERDLDANKLDLARLAGVKPVYVTRNRREVQATAAELVAKVEELLDGERIPPYDVERAGRTIQRRRDLERERAEIIEARKPLNAEFDAKRWSRFFLVTSSAGGHIHSSMNCSTCRVRTGSAGCRNCRA